MSIKLSDEQKKVLFHLTEPGKKYVKILAIAGAGKTALLKAITDITKPKNALYLAYNKAIADESSEKFDKQRVSCITTHSLGYHYIVKGIGYVLGQDITGRSFIQNKMTYPDEIQNDKQKKEYYDNYLVHLEYARKDLLAVIISKFLLSKHIKLIDYIQDEFLDILEPEEIVIANAYVNMMKNKKVTITHSFYLKMLHVMLQSGVIKINQYDLVMLDEAGDINEVTLEIFNLIQCDKKIMVGDNQQNIYSFNATINGFEATKNIGTTFDLSRSFRVSQCLAEPIEKFCKKYLEKSMVFRGVEYTVDQIPETKDMEIAHIFRTNAGLVDKMLELEKMNLPYNCTRSVESLFRMHRTIMFVKPGGTVFDQDLQFIQQDRDLYEASAEDQRLYPTFLGYLKVKNENNVQVKTAIQTILKYGSKTLIDLYKKAKSHEEHSDKHKITLTTAHASKGCEYDIVHIGQDLNDIVQNIITEYDLDDPYKNKNRHPSTILRNSELEEFRLYYVAATRAKFKLYNAEHITNEYYIQDFNMNKKDK